MILGIMNIFALNSYSQSGKVSLNLKNAKVEDVLNQIEKSSEYYFAYNQKLINVNRRVDILAHNKAIKDVLHDLFRNTNTDYVVINRQIVLSPNEISKEELASSVPQQKKGIIITGSVKDAKTGESLPGVSVLIKGTAKGAITDGQGTFSLTVVDANSTLIFSSMGYDNQDVKLYGKTNITVSLVSNVQNLDEIVVVGYGTQKKASVTGSISTVKSTELKDMPVNNIGQKLQGKFSGLQVYQTSGEPGGAISFRVRGQASVNGGNSPLFVIDGFPSLSGIDALSPEEIESITVLKDASASSLYGSRAANGVILVTTKNAKEGQKSIEFSAYTGYESVSDRGMPDVMNATEFAQFKKEYYEDKATYEGYTGGVPSVYQNPGQYTSGTNWLKTLLRVAPVKNYNLLLSSGVKNLKSSVNLNYSKQDGVILNTYFERFSGRANNIFKASEKLTLGLNLAVSYRNSQITPGLGNGRNIIGSAFLMDPSLKYKNDDGTYPISFSAPGMFANPNYYLVLTQRVNPTKETTATANAFAEYEIIKGLKYKLSVNADLGNTANRSFIPSTAQGAMFSAPPLPATGSYGTSNYQSWLIENTLTYEKTINEKHHFDILVGYSAQKATYESSSISASQFPDDEIQWINAATTKIGDASTSQWSILSQIGRLNYNYAGKYLASFAFRHDGCSRFGTNNKWGNFPSLSLGWMASDENFMKSIDKINYLKFRASYGETGNNNIGNYTFLSTTQNSNYVFNGGVIAGKSLNGIGNSDLTWETTKQFDVGFDLGLFKDRIFFVYDFYLKNTNGLLYGVDIPLQSGFSSITSNIGEFKFWGHEFGLETKNFTGKFRWNTNFNISFNRNKAIKLGTNDTPIGGNSNQGDYNRTQVGHPLGQFIGYIYDGVYMTQQELDTQPKHASSMVGTVRMKDISGPNGKPDGVIDMYDRTVIGDPNPDAIFGITNEFYYKNFDASIVLAGSIGGDIIDGTLEWTENLDGVFNVTKEVAERWRSIENPGKGNIPRTRSGTTELFRYNNTRWVSDGSYVAAKNITLGYTLPLIAKEYIKKARVYVSLQNAFYLTKYKGMNPEVSANGLNGLYLGVDNSSYPVSRVYTFGVNITF